MFCLSFIKYSKYVGPTGTGFGIPGQGPAAGYPSSRPTPPSGSYPPPAFGSTPAVAGNFPGAQSPSAPGFGQTPSGFAPAGQAGYPAPGARPIPGFGPGSQSDTQTPTREYLPPRRS